MHTTRSVLQAIEFPPPPQPEQLHEHNYYLRHDTANYPQKREYTVHVPWLPPLEISFLSGANSLLLLHCYLDQEICIHP